LAAIARQNHGNARRPGTYKDRPDNRHSAGDRAPCSAAPAT
jgi:hypothetical protein